MGAEKGNNERLYKKYLKTHWIYYLFVLPFLVLFTVFVIIPVGMAIFTALHITMCLNPPNI
ncbi:MAG: hypothetical protein ACLR56_03660 [Oscillospiraceae bacterium]